MDFSNGGTIIVTSASGAALGCDRAALERTREGILLCPVQLCGSGKWMQRSGEARSRGEGEGKDGFSDRCIVIDFVCFGWLQ